MDVAQSRLGWLTTVAPYVLLAILAAVTAVTGQDRLDLVLCALAALWIFGLYTVHPPWRDRPLVMRVFLAGLLLITLVLVVRNPWFGFYSAACYFYAFRIIGWPAELYFIAGAGLVAGTAQVADLDLGTWLGALGWGATVLANAVPMCGLAWLMRIREAAQAETNAANQRLAAALAENADLQEQLLDQARAAGVLDERQRMARELHDTLAQGLIGIITQLQAAPGAEWQRHHDAAIALARESLTEARRSVHELRPKELETGRLDQALAEVAARWSDRHGVTAEVTTTGTARAMPAAAEAALLRTAQEALANVARHAAATRVGITLSYMDRDVALDVRDDGRGFDPAAPPASDNGGGFGLVGMRQRIEELAGTLRIESEPGGGTGISAYLPAVTAAG
ncbi:sensor histidine kinase [Paractinoplanes durhamensis]|uniref:Oxygen sensor histidine kinase NreB n=1 Tax=Paractinoplanes durhamensis TaxID=113563 RepID=A0ABQ3Z6Q0_9ACTN|nr:sensor histidine kinase [Actinoplanes durhamensis]GIE05451.1 hypothetical protein Adu01nite_68010 [Actinoplanes durhamensis]